jgi:YVTN family beta-propeller protein
MRQARPSSALNWLGVLILSVGITLLLAHTALAFGPDGLFYVVNSKPPSVSVVDPATLKVVADIPLDKNPTRALVGPQNRFLYVLHDGLVRPDGTMKEAEGRLAIVDLQTRETVKKIPLGWNVIAMAFFKDDRYLLCFGQGRARKKKPKDNEGATVAVIDTVKNELTSTLRVGKPAWVFVTTSDASRVFALGGSPFLGLSGDLLATLRLAGLPKPSKFTLTTFSGDSEKPIAELQLGNSIGGMVLSKDQRSLYLLDQGFPPGKVKKGGNGAVHIVDVATGKLLKSHTVGAYPGPLVVDGRTGAVAVTSIVSRKDKRGKLHLLRGNDLLPAGDVGEHPRSIVRIGDLRGLFVMSYTEMRFLPDDGPLATEAIVLNPATRGGAPSAAAGQGLNGYPGELLYLPEQGKVAVLVTNTFGGPTNRLALVNLKDNKVECVITTGRGSVRAGKLIGAIAVTAAAAAGAGALAGAVGSPFFVYPIVGFGGPPSVALSAGPGGRFIYALNSSSNDVTVVGSTDGTVLDKIPVGGSRRIAVAPGGNFLFAIGASHVTLIDTNTNKKHSEKQLEPERVRNFYADKDRSRVWVLTDKSLLVWDADKGNLVGTVSGFGEPYILLRARGEKGKAE